MDANTLAAEATRYLEAIDLPPLAGAGRRHPCARAGRSLRPARS
jgi:hypothetical protein